MSPLPLPFCATRSAEPFVKESAPPTQTFSPMRLTFLSAPNITVVASASTFAILRAPLRTFTQTPASVSSRRRSPRRSCASSASARHCRYESPVTLKAASALRFSFTRSILTMGAGWTGFAGLAVGFAAGFAAGAAEEEAEEEAAAGGSEEFSVVTETAGFAVVTVVTGAGFAVVTGEAEEVEGVTGAEETPGAAAAAIEAEANAASTAAWSMEVRCMLSMNWERRCWNIGSRA